MVFYDIFSLNHETKEITFFFDNDTNKKIKVNVLNGFKEYVVAKNLDFFVDLNNGDLVRILGANNYLIGIRNDFYDYNGQYFRKALQCDVDKDDLIRFNGDNGKMYEYLENEYNNNFK